MASKASSKASHASADETPSNLLENELASLIRVRNRLALSKDEELPKILTGLLPRVLSKLEATYQQQNEDHQFVRSQIRGHLMGILMHALERIRGNPNMTVPWMSAVAVSLESESGVVRMLALTFLQVAIPRCRDSREAIPMASLLKAVDQCYKRQEGGVTEANRLELCTVSWLLLDAIAIVSGLVPMVDWDLDCFNEEGRLGVYEPPREAADTIPYVASESIETVSQDGVGVWDLMLDVLLFWPTSPPRRQWPLENNRAAAEATSGGISLEGRERMAFRLKGRSWNDMTQGYLRYLKAACFNFFVSKENPGLFQGEDGSVGATRALMLSVILANTNSMAGKCANDYLNVHFPEQRLSVFNAPQHPFCSLSMACSLLVLVLGDRASAPIVEQYPSQQHLWVDVLGTLPAETSRMRAPLPPPMSARVIDFIGDHLFVAEAIADDHVEALKLFVDLAVTVQKNHFEDGIWAIRLVYELQKQVQQMDNAPWMDDFHTKCITCAKETLAGLPDPSIIRRAVVRDDTEELVNNRFVARRRAEDDLFARHRSSLRKKRLRYDDALKARENAYELISTLGCLGIKILQADREHEDLSFELPIVLFKCALYEDTMMKPRATKALSDLLSSFKSAVSSRIFDESALQRQVAYLIPSLVDASCCEFEAVRLASVQWATGLLWLIDPPAAYCLCSFLSNDTDLKVSTLAKSVVESKATEKLCLANAAPRPMFEFLDLSSDQDRATLMMELEVRISVIAQRLNIPSSAASVILSSFDGYPKEAIDACIMDRDGVFRRCGVEARCRLPQHDDSTRDCEMDGNFVCGICYDDEITLSDSYTMFCGHRFCTVCYKSFLNTAFEEGPKQILNATCPSHDCTERITGVEVNDLIPEQLEKWKDCFLRQFVDQESHYRFCPGPGCDVAVVSLGDTGPVTCICDTTFCFGCGESPHVPALCEDFEKWQSIFGNSEFWVAKNSKPCPNCGVRIEKDQGCNHINCSQCKFDFCWICLAHLESHMMAHTCNQYDPAAHAGDDDERMRLFFTDRFQAHEEAGLFARKRLDGVESKVQHLLDKLWLDEEEKQAQDLVKAEETLVEARRFLKYSYIAAYGMKDDKSRRKVFESHQGALELLTETLSGLAELNLDTIYVERGENCLQLHLRAIAFYTSIVKKYMERVAHLNDGVAADELLSLHKSPETGSRL